MLFNELRTPTFPPMVAPRSKGALSWGMAILSLMAAVLGTGCDKVPLTAPSGASVSLSSSARILPINGSTEITATVIESAGTAVQNGTLVTFTTSIGSLEPSEARTHNGRASVRLLAGNRSGRAVIRAFSGSASNTGGEESEEFFIDIGGAAAGRIDLTANPGTVSASGGTVTLTAVVFDVDGNRLPGAPVSFTTTTGNIGAPVVTTDANGQASTTLTTSRTAEVTASAGTSGSEGGVVTDTFSVTALALPTVGVTVSTATPTENLPTVFAITAAAGDGTAIRNVTIDFGDGSSQPLGAVTSTSVSHVYSSDGTFVVRVTAEDTNGATQSQSTAVVVQPSAPPLVALAYTPSNPTTDAVVSFTVTITPQGGQTAPAVQSVVFDFGDGNRTEPIQSLTRSHIYGAVGSFLARATVRFVDGSSVVAEAGVLVR